MVSEHFLGNIDQTVAGGFLSYQGTAEGQSFSGQHAFVKAGQSLVLAVQVANFTSAYTDIAGRNVNVCTDVTVQLIHEALAEGHDLTVRFALGVKVSAALAAADGKSRQSVFEDLLKAQELHDTLIYGRMEAKATLVGADGTGELHTISTVYLNLSLIIDPGYAERDHAIRLSQTLQNGIPSVFFLISFDYRTKRVKHLTYCLMKFRFTRIFFDRTSDHFIYI